jgi:ribonuclease PH
MTYTIPMRRSWGRGLDGLRPISIETNPIPHAEGSAYIKLGNTHVLCTATVDENVPRWMKGSGSGWVTAEYSLLPRSTKERTDREAVRGKQGGRTVEIQRLIGRSLRAVTDMKALGERQVILDCDVIMADGGTRCAAITGAYVALALAGNRLVEGKKLKRSPLVSAVAAVSVGIVNGVPLLDLDYNEDVKAGVDANIVMTDKGDFVEVQGTAEGDPFSMATLTRLLDLADGGIRQLLDAQRDAIKG